MAKFFLDSCVFIETLKVSGNPKAKKLWDAVLELYLGHEFFVNAVVKSEVSYHVFCKRKLMSIEDLKGILESFSSLDMTDSVEKLMYGYMSKYHLKPNDALILATCKHYGIKYLVSLDKDFERACAEEKVVLVSDAEKLKAILER